VVDVPLQTIFEVSGASINIPATSIVDGPSLIMLILELPVSRPMALFDMLTPVALS
jgi:hypothetical protein